MKSIVYSFESFEKLTQVSFENIGNNDMEMVIKYPLENKEPIVVMLPEIVCREIVKDLRYLMDSEGGE